MSLLQKRAVVSVAVTVAAALLLVFVVGQYVLRMHASAAETLEQIEPRYARLSGLRDAGGTLEQALKQSRVALSRLGYASDRDAAQAGNDLQQLARRALQSAGVTVVSSQVLPALAEAGFERVRVSLQSEGALSGVQLALAALQTESPRVAFESVWLQATGRNADDGTPVVSCRLVVALLRLKS